MAEATTHFTRCVEEVYPNAVDIDNELFCVVHWPGATTASYVSSNAISFIVIDSI